MSIVNQTRIGALIDSLLPSGVQKKPHKLLLLLAVARLANRRVINAPLISYSQELVDEFKLLFDRFKADGDRNRPYNPFFHLRTSGVWRLVSNPGQEQALEDATSIGGPGDLNRLVKCVSAEGVLREILFNDEFNLAFQQLAEQRLSSQRAIGGLEMENPFVAYLNTLQGIDANNQGALAETQSRQPLFEEIRVGHELAPVILSMLQGDGREACNVILTGHAGDGKSTLALEIVRTIDPNVTFEKKTEVVSDGARIIVVKDLSEWSEAERDALLEDIASVDPNVRYLIVSNTGALLSIFCNRCRLISSDRVTVESELLDAFDATGESAWFSFGVANFAVFNLACRNNIRLGMDMLGKMVESRKWEDCRACPCSSTCPIMANREILRRNREIAFVRIAWLYERAYAYGGRLTMRQLGAHFAFFLTGGLNCQRASRLSVREKDGYRFFNLFWGDDGVQDVRDAVRQLRAVSLMREQGFNKFRSPREDRLLRLGRTPPLSQTDPSLAALEERLREPISARAHEETDEQADKKARYRRNYRRGVYFLGSPSRDENATQDFDRFLDGFLASAKLRDALSWRSEPSRFNGNRLLPSLFRVLQEEFSGIRFAEGGTGGDRLYITLGGRSSNVRRSAQPVLADCDFSRSFSVTLDADGTPVLRGRGRALEDVELRLSIPFLDYIADRGVGALGRGLDRAYRNRIEAFKAALLERLVDTQSEELVLLRKNADGSLSTLSVRIREGRAGKEMEVL